FDRVFFKIMPCYHEMMKALVDAIPFSRGRRIRVVDLGCGTGNLSREIISAYPHTRLTCVDMAENMIKMAESKLAKEKNVDFFLGDIRDFAFPEKCHAIVSSMVLHHIEKKDKLEFYRKLNRSLSKGGGFYVIDIFLASDSHLQSMYMDNWKAFMKGNGFSSRRINYTLARHRSEDRPVVLEDELSIMRKAGFVKTEVILKRYNFALYRGCVKD
ncbi:MAG: class I SAM-dependent methyltransferase, partial [Candidatus Omnitrophica bacterium]|nr:class I SAM-dependent methyltransferase [Candidatus Omnitrophota bacterium]MDD5501818.1 class I SAM-dependent methyltransferase [Candidatus Omnitrophota bacterium]